MNRNFTKHKQNQKTKNKEGGTQRGQSHHRKTHSSNHHDDPFPPDDGQSERGLITGTAGRQQDRHPNCPGEGNLGQRPAWRWRLRVGALCSPLPRTSSRGTGCHHGLAVACPAAFRKTTLPTAITNDVCAHLHLEAPSLPRGVHTHVLPQRCSAGDQRQPSVCNHRPGQNDHSVDVNSSDKKKDTVYPGWLSRVPRSGHVLHDPVCIHSRDGKQQLFPGLEAWP